MTNEEIKALIVGPKDTLFITFNGDNVNHAKVEDFKKKLIKFRPDLEERVVIIAGNDVSMSVLQPDNSRERRSMKGVC